MVSSFFPSSFLMWGRIGPQLQSPENRCFFRWNVCKNLNVLTDEDHNTTIKNHPASKLGMAMRMRISASTSALSDNIALYPTYVG